MARTIIGGSIEIEGDVKSDDPLVIRGRVTGRIETSQSVVVDAAARVEAELVVDTIEVTGEVAGPITAATRVSIGAEGRVAGDVVAPRIHIADGARFKGHIDMDRGTSS